MTDELDDLKAAFDAATPTPDPARKRENIAQAEKKFALRQGSAAEARQTIQKGPLGAALNGVTAMFTTLTSRAGLTATTALVAVGLLVVLPNVGDMQLPKTGFENLGQTGAGHVQGPALIGAVGAQACGVQVAMNRGPRQELDIAVGINLQVTKRRIGHVEK